MTVDCFFFFKQKTAYEMRISDWSSDVCSSDLLAWLNIGQSLVTNAAMAGAMAYTVWGWSQGDYKVGDVVLVNTLLAQLFRPLDMLGMVYRMIRQGLIDMEAMFRLIDTPSEIRDAAGAAALRVGGGDRKS